MADLPADVIANIFSRLPVRSLLQFRSISKSCRFLIDSDHFKTLHFNNFNKLNSNLILRDNSELYAVDLTTPGNAVPLNKPLKLFENHIIIIGSCNGLLCIKNRFNDIAIWNPSLRMHWIIPSGFYACFYGFGFDSFTEDYKLVKICPFGYKVGLFNCRTNAWKTLPNMPYGLYWCANTANMGVFVDHAVHWVVTKNPEFTCSKLIVAFDLRFEVFNEVPLPELGEGFQIQVSQLGGCLSMVVNYYHIITGIDFWVMKQYGSKDGWFKVFTSVKCLKLSRALSCVKPLGYSSDGMKVLFEHLNKLIWYNFKSKQASHVTNPGMPNFDEAIIWVESLVQPPFPSDNYRKQ